MKILALDLGDVHTGTALTDDSLIISFPFQTVPSQELNTFLKKLFKEELIKKVIVGKPINNF